MYASLFDKARRAADIPTVRARLASNSSESSSDGADAGDDPWWYIRRCLVGWSRNDGFSPLPSRTGSGDGYNNNNGGGYSGGGDRGFSNGNRWSFRNWWTEYESSLSRTSITATRADSGDSEEEGPVGQFDDAEPRSSNSSSSIHGAGNGAGYDMGYGAGNGAGSSNNINFGARNGGVRRRIQAREEALARARNTSTPVAAAWVAPDWLEEAVRDCALEEEVLAETERRARGRGHGRRRVRWADDVEWLARGRGRGRRGLRRSDEGRRPGGPEI